MSTDPFPDLRRARLGRDEAPPDPGLPHAPPPSRPETGDDLDHRLQRATDLVAEKQRAFAVQTPQGNDPGWPGSDVAASLQDLRLYIRSIDPDEASSSREIRRRLADIENRIAGM